MPQAMASESSFLFSSALPGRRCRADSRRSQAQPTSRAQNRRCGVRTRRGGSRSSDITECYTTGTHPSSSAVRRSYTEQVKPLGSGSITSTEKGRKKERKQRRRGSVLKRTQLKQMNETTQRFPQIVLALHHQPHMERSSGEPLSMLQQRKGRAPRPQPRDPHRETGPSLGAFVTHEDAAGKVGRAQAANDTSQYFQDELIPLKLSSTPGSKVWTRKYISPFRLLEKNNFPATFLSEEQGRQGSSSTNTSSAPITHPTPLQLKCLRPSFQHLQLFQTDLQLRLSCSQACPRLSQSWI